MWQRWKKDNTTLTDLVGGKTINKDKFVKMTAWELSKHFGVVMSWANWVRATGWEPKKTLNVKYGRPEDYKKTLEVWGRLRPIKVNTEILACYLRLYQAIMGDDKKYVGGKKHESMTHNFIIAPKDKPDQEYLLTITRPIKGRKAEEG